MWGFKRERERKSQVLMFYYSSCCDFLLLLSFQILPRLLILFFLGKHSRVRRGESSPSHPHSPSVYVRPYSFEFASDEFAKAQFSSTFRHHHHQGLSILIFLRFPLILFSANLGNLGSSVWCKRGQTERRSRPPEKGGIKKE